MNRRREEAIVFEDRADAGARLADAVVEVVGRDDCVVVGLPRGGVPVAREVAVGLGAPLDVLMVAKLGVPWQPELAFGAVSTGDVVFLNDEVVAMAELDSDEVDRIVDRARGELARREGTFRSGRQPVDVEGQTVVLVDDGIATGATVRAALRALRERGAARVVVACPVAPRETVEGLREEADEVVCISIPAAFRAVGLWYRDFTPVRDEEVREILAAGTDGASGESGA